MGGIKGRNYPDLLRAGGCHSRLPHRCATDTMSTMSVMCAGSDLSAHSEAMPPVSTPIIVYHGDVDGTVQQKNSADVVRQNIECYQA